MDVVTVNFYSTACSAEFLQGAFSLPVGCRATGGMENGQARLQSQSVQISGNNLVSKSFTGSLDCTGTYAEASLPCDQVCVNGSTTEGLPDGFYAFQSTCSSLPSTGLSSSTEPPAKALVGMIGLGLWLM